MDIEDNGQCLKYLLENCNKMTIDVQRCDCFLYIDRHCSFLHILVFVCVRIGAEPPRKFSLLLNLDPYYVVLIYIFILLWWSKLSGAFKLMPIQNSLPNILPICHTMIILNSSYNELMSETLLLHNWKQYIMTDS